MRVKLAILVATALLVAGSYAVAQSYLTNTPVSGTFTLTSGFTPDPQTVSLTPGGTTGASQLGAPAECRGSVWGVNDDPAAGPDIRIEWTAGTSFPILRFFVVSTADTTLVIRGPDGLWHCNDDGDVPGAGLNPVIDMSSPMSGVYSIWVGTFGGGVSAHPGTLYVTEVLTNGPETAY